MRPITVSFGKGDKAAITAVRQMSWEDFAAALTAEPPESDDKASRGWYIPATFNPVYRHGDNFVSRDAITFDFDHVGMESWATVLQALPNIALAMYTTHSHNENAPRFRVVVPLSRPTSFDEFQAVSRKLASGFGIELAARESFTPPQMTYLPLRSPRGLFDSHIQGGSWVDVDQILRTYDDWTDKLEWPRHASGDDIHAPSTSQLAPDEKPGPVGAFCRAFRVAAAIARFDLPYKPSPTPNRWTYIHGSVADGAIEYDDGLKFHSHHDTDPARGQNNAFDLVRLHRFGGLDAESAAETPVADKPSYRAMCSLVSSLPECAASTAAEEFEDLGPLPIVTEEVVTNESGHEKFHVWGAGEFSSGPPVDWIVRGVLPRAELAVIYGESGSGKSFLALDLCAAVTRGLAWRSKRTTKGCVVYVCAEGAGGFKARLRAYAAAHGVGFEVLPAVIPDAPNLREQTEAAALYGAIVKWGKPDVIVIDTLSATTPGGNENSGEDMGLVLSHCKLLHRKTGALVVLIHHSGKDATKGARGWSGLRAAADAEIEITRNGDFRAATVTKLKDAGDYENFAFKLKVVELGNDLDGEPESSCVIEHIGSAPPESSRKVQPKGLPKLVLDTLKIMAPSGTCNIEDLIEGVKTKLPKAEGRDLRRQYVTGALMRSLIPLGWAFMHGEDRIGLTNIRQLEEPAWLSE
jgi:AAA domain